MTFEFVLIDLTTAMTPVGMKPAYGVMAYLISAWEEQVNGPFSEAWGCPLVSFRIAEGAGDRRAKEIAINFRDDIPEAPDALAYHMCTRGIPDIEIGVDLFTSLLTGQDSVCCGGSHEVLELLLNPGANGWKDRQDGSGISDAEEACDYVQNTGYAASNGGTVSNFVLPALFLPGASGPWDYLHVMTARDDLSHGYGIIAETPANVEHIGGLAHASFRKTPVRRIGELTPLQARRKHPYSRTYRRLTGNAP